MSSTQHGTSTLVSSADGLAAAVTRSLPVAVHQLLPVILVAQPAVSR